MLMPIYKSKSSAIRAAKDSCKKALSAPGYIAAEGHDFIIHPSTDDNAEIGFSAKGVLDLGYRWSFELRGPAHEISND